jgi:hypothetical protein
MKDWGVRAGYGDLFDSNDEGIRKINDRGSLGRNFQIADRQIASTRNKARQHLIARNGYEHDLKPRVFIFWGYL